MRDRNHHIASHHPPGGPRNALLLVVCLAQFMVILDVAIVNVALPSIHGDLGFSATGLQWVINAYTLTFAGFLMLGGRAADLLGHRRVLLVGTAAFALDLAAVRGRELARPAHRRARRPGPRRCDRLARDARDRHDLVRRGPERNRALGAWVTMGALGASSGALLGGVLTQALGWPAIFAINAPLGLLAIVLGLRVIPAGTRRRPARATSTCSARCSSRPGWSRLTYGIVRSDELGWGSAGVLGPLAGRRRPARRVRFVEGASRATPLVPLRSSGSRSCAPRTSSSCSCTRRCSRCSTS